MQARVGAMLAALFLAQGCGKTLDVRIPDPYEQEGIYITVEKVRADWPIGLSVRGVAQNRTGREAAKVYIAFELRDASDRAAHAEVLDSRGRDPGERWRFKAVSLAGLEQLSFPFPQFDANAVARVEPGDVHVQFSKD